MGLNVGSIDDIRKDFTRLVNEYRAARRGEGKPLANTLGSRFLFQSAQETADLEGSRYAFAPDAIPPYFSDVTTRVTNGVRGPSGALNAFKGTRVIEVLVTGCVDISEAFIEATKTKEGAAAFGDKDITSIGGGVSGCARSGLFVWHLGIGTGDRSGVMETEENVPYLRSTWNPEDVANDPNRKVQVVVR